MSAIKLLIEHGANIEVKNMYNKTARDILARKFPNQITLSDQAVKAYQDKKNSNQSLQDKKESSPKKPKFSLSSFSFLNSYFP